VVMHLIAPRDRRWAEPTSEHICYFTEVGSSHQWQNSFELLMR